MSKFSDFIRNATPEEKAEVYAEVMQRATESQNAAQAATPRTDAIAREVVDAMTGGGPQWDYIVPADFARQLERVLRWCVDHDGECLGDHPQILLKAKEALEHG